MEIRPETLEKLLAESDERLWETIRKVGVMNNITLPLTPPSGEEMAKLRLILRSGGLNYEQALGVLDSYRKGEKP